MQIINTLLAHNTLTYLSLKYDFDSLPTVFMQITNTTYTSQLLTITHHNKYHIQHHIHHIQHIHNKHHPHHKHHPTPHTQKVCQSSGNRSTWQDRYKREYCCIQQDNAHSKTLSNYKQKKISPFILTSNIYSW